MTRNPCWKYINGTPHEMHSRGLDYEDDCPGLEEGELPEGRVVLFLRERKVIDARQADATTCPSCRVAVPLGQFCSCPMRWKG